MRFLHTADWHLGRTMRGRSRSAEFEAVLTELIEIATAERVDVALVCGDIWDSASPAPESDRLLYEALRELIGRRIDVVLIGGNHDSARKLDALGRLSELLGVRTQAYVRRFDRGGVITIERGGEAARIAAIPWVPDGRVLNAVEILGEEFETRKVYHDFVADVYAHMIGGFDAAAVNILAGHVFIDGSVVASVDGSERRLHIDRAYGLSPQALPSEPQYLALGHVHQPQVITDAPAPTAYSGSLLQLDFGERGQEKVVRIVEAHPRRPVEQRAVPLTKLRQLVELRGTADEVMAQAEAAPDAYVRAVLEVATPEPGLAQRLRDAVPMAVDVRLDYARDAVTDPEAEFASLSPEELFVRYYRSEHGAEPKTELLALFRELLDEAVALA